MNKLKRYIGLIGICMICLLVLTACSSKKSDFIKIYASENLDDYREAAKKRFSSVGTSNGNYKKDNLDEPMDVGGITFDPPRYVVVISDEREILDSKPINGKRYSIFVHDTGDENITISMHYLVGTTDNCVVKGNVTSGELSYNRTLYINAPANLTASERAEFIIDSIYDAIVDVEGK